MWNKTRKNKKKVTSRFLSGKTKIFLTIMFTSSLTYTSLAQFSTEQKSENDWGCAIAINSIQAQVAIPLMTGPGAQIIDADGNILTGGNRRDKSFSFSIVPKYYINEDFLFRFEFGITNLHLKANSDQKSGDHYIVNTEVSNKIYRYSPGFQWIFMKTKKLESYCGMTASYVDYKSLYYNLYFEHRELKTDTIQYWGRNKETTPGGFSVGLGAFAGFSIYLHKRISLGAELSSSAMYYKLGGETTTESVGQVVPNPVNSGNSTYTNSYKGFKISKIISSFNISVWF